jgi:hypothetical protein
MSNKVWLSLKIISCTDSQSKKQWAKDSRASESGSLIRQKEQFGSTSLSKFATLLDNGSVLFLNLKIKTLSALLRQDMFQDLIQVSSFSPTGAGRLIRPANVVMLLNVSILKLRYSTLSSINLTFFDPFLKELKKLLH